MSDEEWATKARFQYCDMTKEDGGYSHCYDQKLRGSFAAVGPFIYISLACSD